MHNKAWGFLLEIAMLTKLIGLVLVTITLSSQAAEPIDWVQRSLDKTIVVKKDGHTFTVAAPEGSGRRVIQRGNHKVIRDYGPGYRNDENAQAGCYDRCATSRQRLRRSSIGR